MNSGHSNGIGNGRGRKRLAIVGNGMAAGRLLDDLLARGATARYAITVFGEEPGAAYNRILLGRVLGGEHPDAISLAPLAPGGGDLDPADVRFRAATTVAKLDPAARTLHTAAGESLGYDLAVLATGSKPFVPPIAGLMTAANRPRPGVFAYRTLADALAMRALAKPGDSAVILGGGLLGLEAAKTLADAGLHVTVVHRGPHLMDSQLDATAGRMLRRQIERHGVFVRTGATLAAVAGRFDAADSPVAQVTLDDGETLAADLCILAVGIRPRTDAAAASGIEVNRGVVVNDLMATRAPGVYAVGECAEHAGVCYGIVGPIYEQSAVLADVLSGANPAARYRGSRPYTRLKVAGVEVASMGRVGPELPTDEVVQVVEEHRHCYRKLIVRDGKLLGAHLVGDAEAAAALVQLFDRGEELPPNRLEVLCPLAGGGPADREVCNCHHVAQSAIRSAIAGGADSLDAIGAMTKAGTGCGSCKPQLARALATARPASPA